MASEAGATGNESVRAAVCLLIGDAARANRLPEEFLTRLIWRESSFRSNVVSSAGARGIAQFMPGTAQERGLLNPFDPEEAIPAAAKFVADLHERFGNLGLAAAAYNGGPARVANWLRGSGPLYDETRTYVLFITGRSVEDWAQKGSKSDAGGDAPCLTTVAALVVRDPVHVGTVFAPWGVQLAANFSRDAALRSYQRARTELKDVLPELEPMIIGSRFRARGTRPFYRVRVPQGTRAAATSLCNRIRAAGGNCIVLPS
ncbi:MAG: lytic transglycosylase domain-containing protein [Beijerinckiaceae bacterium]|nr:lytic transglycosylase domain-containing protein [Beijerinckiaceae bacterium]